MGVVIHLQRLFIHDRVELSIPSAALLLHSKICNEAPGKCSSHDLARSSASKEMGIEPAQLSTSSAPYGNGIHRLDRRE